MNLVLQQYITYGEVNLKTYYTTQKKSPYHVYSCEYLKFRVVTFRPKKEKQPVIISFFSSAPIKNWLCRGKIVLFWFYVRTLKAYIKVREFSKLCSGDSFIRIHLHIPSFCNLLISSSNSCRFSHRYSTDPRK